MPNGVAAMPAASCLQRVERGVAFLAERREELGRGMLALALVAPQDQKLQQAVAERVTAQRRPLRLRIGRKQLRTVVQRVEIFADHDRVIERRTVVQHQRRQLAQRIVGLQRLVGRSSSRPRCAPARAGRADPIHARRSSPCGRTASVATNAVSWMMSGTSLWWPNDTAHRWRGHARNACWRERRSILRSCPRKRASRTQ